MVSLEQQKLSFLNLVGVTSEDHALAKCWRAAVSRNLTYSDLFSGRETVRATFNGELLSYRNRYRNGVSEEHHFEIVENIANLLSQRHSEFLHNGTFRIGTTQKALNLWLKMMWSLEPEWALPPHCPIDRNVLEAAGIRGNWTELNSLHEYRHWISLLRSHATVKGYSSLSEWELYAWSSV